MLRKLTCLSMMLMMTTVPILAADKGPKGPPPEGESEYYTIEELPIPEGVVLEVGAIEVLPHERLAVATRRGEIYIIDGAFGSDLSKVKYTLFASGLHEPLGLAWKDGSLYATQRPEVTRLQDTNGDDRTDVFETVANGWGISGDYHEFAFGSRFDKDNNIWVVLCLTGSASAHADFRGWCMRVTPDGKTLPTASGIRSPGGIGFDADGEVFYTDNQGLWNGSSSVKHLTVGAFEGNPSGNGYYSLTDAIGPRPTDPKSGSRILAERARIPEFVPPSVILPHAKMGQSPTGIAYDASGKFGPFTKQLFVGEQTWSQVQRVEMEVVNGVYQGAAYPFLSGFKCGLIGVRMADNGVLFVGGSDRGWGSRGGKPFTLERVTWTGKIPFEVHHTRATPDGFVLTFTEKVDPKTAGDVASYQMREFTYIYQSGYGSPEVDEVKPTITKAIVSDDGMSVRLTIDLLTKGHVHELHMDGVRSADGAALLHPVSYYTLNEIPAK
ncbi:MAG: hypothetical protein GC162_11550 [Planctomycetes bacterium]|nr:hypothetical protein [Planctomycetota bacterium]